MTKTKAATVSGERVTVLAPQRVFVPLPPRNARSEARLRMLRGPGTLYFVYSRYCDWIKFGFTAKPLPERLEAIGYQYAEFAPFSLIGAIPSTWRAEQQLHRCFKPFRRRRQGLTSELYPAAPALVGTVKNILTYRQWKPMEIDETLRVMRWARRASDWPLNSIEMKLAFERFDAERAAA